LCLDFADLESNPSNVEQSIKDFLGLEQFRFNPTETEKNKAGQPRLPFLQNMIYSNAMKNVTKHIPINLKPTLLKWRKKLVRANTVDRAYPPLDARSDAMLRSRLKKVIDYYESKSFLQ
jgi:hypothetical protein